MKRTVIGTLSLCCLSLLAACGPGKAEQAAVLQAALKQAGELESVAVTIVTTAKMTAEDGTESTSQSTRTCWRDGENTLQEYHLPVVDGVSQDRPPMMFAVVDGVSYQKSDHTWQKVDAAADFGWHPQSDVPSDAEQYTLEQDGSTFLVRLTSGALADLMQEDIQQAKAAEAEGRAEGRDEEADAQAASIENLEQSRYIQRDIAVTVDDAQTAAQCTSHLIWEGYDAKSGQALTAELTVAWEITSRDQEEISAKITEAIREIDKEQIRS